MQHRHWDCRWRVWKVDRCSLHILHIKVRVKPAHHNPSPDCLAIQQQVDLWGKLIMVLGVKRSTHPRTTHSIASTTDSWYLNSHPIVELSIARATRATSSASSSGHTSTHSAATYRLYRGSHIKCHTAVTAVVRAVWGVLEGLYVCRSTHMRGRIFAHSWSSFLCIVTVLHVVEFGLITYWILRNGLLFYK